MGAARKVAMPLGDPNAPVSMRASSAAFAAERPPFRLTARHKATICSCRYIVKAGSPSPGGRSPDCCEQRWLSGVRDGDRGRHAGGPICGPFFENAEGFNMPLAPPTSTLTLSGSGETLQVYDGDVVLRLPVTQNNRAAHKDDNGRCVTISGWVHWQACNDVECFLPRSCRSASVSRPAFRCWATSSVEPRGLRWPVTSSFTPGGTPSIG